MCSVGAISGGGLSRRFGTSGRIRPSPRCPGGAQLFSGGFELYGSRPDKGWSLTDCISFIVMKEQEINRALTADLHFVQAGFRALLRE